MPNENEVVQYVIINGDLGMSRGKIAPQVGHAIQIETLRAVSEIGVQFQRLPGGRFRVVNPDASREAGWYARFFDEAIVKISLKATTAELESLEAAGFTAIRDAGRTEIPAGSLTVVVLPPMPRQEVPEMVRRLPLFR